MCPRCDRRSDYTPRSGPRSAMLDTSGRQSCLLGEPGSHAAVDYDLLAAS